MMMRESFDRYLLGIAPMCVTKHTDGVYHDSEIQARWETWQAAIASVRSEIELSRQSEREVCAQLAEGATAYTQFQTVEHYKIAALIAAAIRTR